MDPPVGIETTTYVLRDSIWGGAGVSGGAPRCLPGAGECVDAQGRARGLLQALLPESRPGFRSKPVWSPTWRRAERATPMIALPGPSAAMSDGITRHTTNTHLQHRRCHDNLARGLIVPSMKCASPRKTRFPATPNGPMITTTQCAGYDPSMSRVPPEHSARRCPFTAPPGRPPRDHTGPVPPVDNAEARRAR